MGSPSAPFSAVPLFPLPNVVLFPRAILPLHIFEDRYRKMMADVLTGDRNLAMALLRPGWQHSYHARPAIEPVVCVGSVLTHQKSADGTYNILLQGHTRARIVTESDERAYRAATLEPLAFISPEGAALDQHRARFGHLFRSSALADLPSAGQFRELIDGTMPTPDLADLIAFHLLEDAALKQSLLGEADAARRVATTAEALARLYPTAPSPYLRIRGHASLN